MLTTYFKAAHCLKRLRSGPAGPFIDGFTEYLEKAGYARRVICIYLRDVSHFSLWAKTRDISVADLAESTISSFRQHLRSCRCLARNRGGQSRYCDALRHLRRFLDYLPQKEVVAPASPEQTGPVEAPLLVGFRRWMCEHRGVTQSTLAGYARTVTDFLETLGDDVRKLDAQRVRTFVLSRTKLHSRGNARHIASAIRMFLRYLIAEGKCRSGLDGAIPSVAQWRLSALPRYLVASDVERVIAACDPSSPDGCRDRAIILLLARLGLRAGDVVGLRLSDIDWQQASVRLSGKGRREVRLPLPQDVGDAILDYLEHARPHADSDHVFLRTIAPARPLSKGNAVSRIAAKAMRRAGVVAPCSPGAHVLRHSLATEMLRQGASLQRIGGVLRHRSLRTTAHYAKVDLTLLRLVVQPWPEV